MKQMSSAVAAAARASNLTKPSDKLEQARDMVREVRACEAELKDLMERVTEKSNRISVIRTKELPDLMQELQIKSIGIDAQGNDPAFEAKLKSYYSANISVNWPQEKQQRAFDWLEKNRAGDLVKKIITVRLGLGDGKLGKAVEAALKKIKVGKTRVEYEVKRGVPHGTLTAYVREQIEEHKTMPPLDLLGATVGSVVDINPVKEKN